MVVWQVIGEFHLGDFVNAFQHGSLVMQMADNEGGRIPTILFGTLLGGIGVVASLPAATYQLLEKLQASCLCWSRNAHFDRCPQCQEPERHMQHLTACLTRKCDLCSCSVVRCS